MKLKKDELFEIYENKHKREICGDEEEERVISDGIENKKKSKIYYDTKLKKLIILDLLHFSQSPRLDIEVNHFKRFRPPNFWEKKSFDFSLFRKHSYRSLYLFEKKYFSLYLLSIRKVIRIYI